MPKIVAVVLLFLSVLSPSETSKTEQAPIEDLFTFPVKVQVFVDSKTVSKSAMKGYIHRELRKIKDVKIVDEDPDYSINLLIMKTISRTGLHNGYAYSLAIDWHWHCTCSNRIVQERIRNTILTSGPPIKEVHDKLSEYVLEFEVDVIEYLRQENESFKNRIEQFRKNKQDR